MRKSIFFLMASSIILLAEPSVYSDADFIDPTEIAKKNSREIFRLKQKISSLNEKIEGLKSLINSQENQIAILKEKSNNNYAKIINELAQKVAVLENKINNQSITLSNNIKNESYVKETPPQESLKVEKKESLKKKKLSNKELYKRAVLDFNNKRYTAAKNAFKKLLLHGYKSAESNFYLGEIAYNRAKYKEAIKYYQNSATLNEDAIYMDKLLLHTAIALTKIGKKNDAKSFFQAIVDSYPGTASAKEAKKYLK